MNRVNRVRGGWGLAASLLLLCAPAASAATRYAAPAGSGAACTAGTPCSLDTALGSAAADDEVVVTPGSYGTDAVPLPTSMQIGTSGLNVHGVAGQPRPQIVSAADYALTFSGSGVTVSHLAIKGVKPGGGQTTFGLNGSNSSGSIADDVEAWATTGPIACLVAGSAKTFRNSICRDTSASNGNAALWASTGLAGRAQDIALRNMTLWSEQGFAVRASATAPPNDRPVTMSLYNSIARGGGPTQIFVEEPAGAAASVTAFNSNYGAVSLTAGAEGPNATFNPTTATEPDFVDEANGNFAQAPGSVTIDQGVEQAANGPFAFGGLVPRNVGGAPDIGADEKVQRPSVTAPVVSAIARGSARLDATVNPNGLATTYRIEYGVADSFSRSGPTVSVPVGTAPVAGGLDLTALGDSETYTARVVATNAQGTTAGPTVAFITPPTPAVPVTPKPTTTPVPPTPPQLLPLAKLSRVSLSPSRVKAGRTASLTLTLDRASTVRIELRRGRKLVRSSTRSLKAGRTRLKLSKTFLGRRKGRYTLRVTPRQGTRSGTAVAKTLTIR